MQRNVRKQHVLKTQQRKAVRSCAVGNRKEGYKVVSYRTRYKVAYNWNRGGRLKELRIRHLARKYLKIWLKNTFGRVLPHRARSHHDRRFLFKSFEAWKEDWWTTRREWSLVVRAECHNKYTLYNWTFHCWHTFIATRRQKIEKSQQAGSYADKQLIGWVWENWAVCVQMKHKKGRRAHLAVQQNRLSKVRSTWKAWQAKLQQHLDMHALEDQALEHQHLTLLSKAWLQWKDSHRATCIQRPIESKALHLHSQGLQRKVLHQWTSYIRSRKGKKYSNAVVGCARSKTLLEACWRKWQSMLVYRKDRAERLQAAEHLAKQCIQRTAMECWKTYMALCREEADRDQMASQHRHQHLLWAGLQGLSLNISQSKAHRQNKNVAVQHLQQTIKSKYWRSWQDGLEEKEERFLYPQLTTAQTYYRCRQHCWVFYTWLDCSHQTREQRLAREMAVLHHKHWCLQRDWGCWKRRAWQQIDQGEKGYTADRLHLHRLLQNTTGRWKDKAADKRDRRKVMEQVCLHWDIRHMRWAVTEWQKFVQSQQEESRRLNQMRRHHEVKLLKHSIQAWKEYHQQTGQIYGRVEDHSKLNMQRLLRRVLTEWKENTTSRSEARVNEQRALRHFQKCLQFKVFLAWRQAAVHAIAKRYQQGDVLTSAQSHIKHVWQQERFRQWRLQTNEKVKYRTEMEKAAQHHESKLLSSALKSWTGHHRHHQKYQARKRQGTFLLGLKMYQKYFGVWQMELGRRRQTAEQTAISLWHWSFGLQSKALYTWRLWVSDRRRKGERLARGVQFYQDQLLRRGVTRLLTHAALMSSLAAGQAQHSQQTSQGLHRTVWRCASRWKQQSLCTQQGVPRDSRPQPKKKSMTFSCPTPALNPKEDAPCQVALKRMLRLQPRQPKELLESPVKELGHVRAEGPLGVSKPTNNQAVLWHGLHGLEAPCENENVLLPPSSFMTMKSQTKAGNSCPRDDSLIPSDQISHSSIIISGSYMTAPGEDVEVCSVKETADPATPLTTELLQIQVEMKHFQQDRKQLWAWQTLREVLRSWLETCGEEDDIERESVYLDLAGLEESINRLSEDLAKQKPAIVLHAARVQYLDAVLSGHALHSSGHTLHSSGHTLHSSGHALHSRTPETL